MAVTVNGRDTLPKVLSSESAQDTDE